MVCTRKTGIEGASVVASLGYTGYTVDVKTAISLPDDLFRALDDRARQLRVTRSGLIATATREYLARQAPTSDATESWNRALAKAGQPGDDAAAVAFRRRSKTVLARTRRRDAW
jgi:predicted transcriptional regulator